MEFKKYGENLISETLVIKNRTNEGNLSKANFAVVGKNNADVCLVMHRLTLAPSGHKFYRQFAYAAKRYKDKTLWLQNTAIKLSTLQEVMDWLNTMEVPNELK